MATDAQFEIVGIINVTPDSFSDGGVFFDPEKAIAGAHKMFEQGAAIVDIGAESTRPGAEQISVAEEWRRLRPVLAALLPEYPGQISLDTRHPDIVRKAFSMKLGEFIINDVTTFNDQEMIQVAVDTGYTCIVSHLPFWAHGDIERAHSNTDRLVDSMDEVRDELLQRRDEMIAAGIQPDKVILDPGIGFGKTMRLNRELVKFAEEVTGIPVLIGYSQKRFLGETQRYNPRANQQQGFIAKQSGARYIRVHDVKAHMPLAA